MHPACSIDTPSKGQCSPIWHGLPPRVQTSPQHLQWHVKRQEEVFLHLNGLFPVCIHEMYATFNVKRGHSAQKLTLQ